MVRYMPNGSGRDAFVIANNGGLINNFSELGHHFFDKNLR